MRVVLLLILSLFSLCIWVNSSPKSAATCLAAQSGDSKAFGSALAVSKDDLAVGDPQANRVVLYRRNASDGWSRAQDILPPVGSTANEAGAGFGYSLEWREGILVIGAYDQHRRPSDNVIQYVGAIYVAKLNSDRSISIQEISIPQINLVVGYTVAWFGNKVAFAGKVEVAPGRWIERILVADPINRQITRVIGAPKRPEEDYTWPQLESPPSVDFDNFGPSIAGHHGTLLIGVTGAPPRGGMYLATANGRVRRAAWDAEGLYPLSVAGTSVVLSDDLIGIGRSSGFGPSDTLVLRRMADRSLYVGAADLSGSLDVSGSHVLISTGQVQGLPTPATRPEHLLVRVDRDEIVVESEIRWQRGNAFPIVANGIIDSDHLILSAEGKVMQISIKDLPDSYMIRNCQ